MDCRIFLVQIALKMPYVQHNARWENNATLCTKIPLVD